jgi:hypothetical protein
LATSDYNIQKKAFPEPDLNETNGTHNRSKN